jgi:hypothetical protein
MGLFYGVKNCNFLTVLKDVFTFIVLAMIAASFFMFTFIFIAFMLLGMQKP